MVCVVVTSATNGVFPNGVLKARALNGLVVATKLYCVVAVADGYVIILPAALPLVAVELVVNVGGVALLVCVKNAGT